MRISIIVWSEDGKQSLLQAGFDADPQDVYTPGTKQVGLEGVKVAVDKLLESLTETQEPTAEYVKENTGYVGVVTVLPIK